LLPETSPPGNAPIQPQENGSNSIDGLVPALFLDRDGIVNREIGYLSKPHQVEFLPGIFDLCRSAQAMGYKLIIVTNQAGIARQLYSEADFHLLMRWMVERFTLESVRLDGYYYCPHHPEHGVGRYRKDCPDRKPQPGMMLRAAREHGIDLGQSVFLGDRCSDMDAGAAAEIGRLILLAGTETAECESAAYHVVVSTFQEVTALLARRSLHK
jgi:D-glycero-D-manno-heptose 1,7-bisphosphate phosphatase